MTVLEGEALKQGLETLEGWEKAADKPAIQKTFQFKHFRAAWGFMSQVALSAEKMNHHPDWSNSYNSVHVQLSTHDAGGVTENDLELARKMNQASGNFG